MYILTFHGTVVGITAEMDLVQKEEFDPEDSSFIEIDDIDEEINSGPLSGFRLVRKGQHVHFMKDGNFLCADPRNQKLVADRKRASSWETFKLFSRDQYRGDTRVVKKSEFFEADSDVVFAMLKKSLEAFDVAVELNLDTNLSQRGFCTVDFREDGTICFTIRRIFATKDVYTNITTRLSHIAILFALVRKVDPELVGECNVCLSDFALRPSIAFCGNNMSHCLIPDPDFIATKGYQNLRSENFRSSLKKWPDRNKDIYWRGTLTGRSLKYPISNWRTIPRAALCLKTRNVTGFDVALTGDPIQAPDLSQRQEILASGLFAPRATYDDFAAHRTLIDIDGNSNAWSGFMTKLLMGSTVLKIDSLHGFHQWYYGKLKPWKHFIPIDTDFVQLLSVAEWIDCHPYEAQQIAEEGFALADSITFESAINETIPKIIDFVRTVGPRNKFLRMRMEGISA